MITEKAAQDILAGTFDVSRETLLRLEDYRLLLVKWAKQINLVGPSTLTHFWERHALDCAQLLPIAGPSARVFADFGSGAGLPGLVLASLLGDQAQPYHVHLVESSVKRCGFLREAIRTLGVSATVHQTKIEALAPFKVDIVTARAFAPLDKLIGYAHPWTEFGARTILFKGEDVQTEIDQASTNWSFQTRIKTSVTDSRGCIIEIDNLTRL